MNRFDLLAGENSLLVTKTLDALRTDSSSMDGVAKAGRAAKAKEVPRPALGDSASFSAPFPLVELPDCVLDNLLSFFSFEEVREDTTWNGIKDLLWSPQVCMYNV